MVSYDLILARLPLPISKQVESELIRDPGTWSINPSHGFSPARSKIGLQNRHVMSSHSCQTLTPSSIGGVDLLSSEAHQISSATQMSFHQCLTEFDLLRRAPQGNRYTNSAIAFLESFSITCTTRAMIKHHLTTPSYFANLDERAIRSIQIQSYTYFRRSRLE